MKRIVNSIINNNNDYSNNMHCTHINARFYKVTQAELQVVSH